MEKVCELIDFSCGYASGRAIVRSASLAFRGGELTAIVGPNGAGKSTLLRGVAGIMPWAEGDVVLCGRRLSDMSRREVSQSIALMGSSTARLGMTVGEFVLLGRTPYKGLLSVADSTKDKDLALEALNTVGMTWAKDAPLSELSDGQRQLTGLARALVQQPRLLLLDEPTSNLDPRNAERVLSVVKALAHDRALAVVAVMHDVNAALRWADSAIVMTDGRVSASGPAAQSLSAERLTEAYGVNFQVSDGLFPTAGN